MTSIGLPMKLYLRGVNIRSVLTGENGESENLIIDGFKLIGSHGVLLSNILIDSTQLYNHLCNIPYQVASYDYPS